MMKNLIFLIISLVCFITVTKAQKPLSSTTYFKGVKVPGYCGSGDTTRTPIFFQATVSGYAANTKFKYFVSFISISDTSSSTTTGSGENLLVRPKGNIIHSDAPDFTAGNHDTLTIGSGGEFTGWFGALTTNNTSFTAGTYVYPMIVMQEIKTGTPPILKYYLTDSIKVLAFSKTPGGNNGSGIYGSSFTKGNNIVVLYDELTGTSRPITITYSENDGNNIPNMPFYYNNKVNSRSGSWGGIIPNTLANGIKRIEAKNPFGGAAVLYFNRETDAIWGSDSTINPHSGLNAIFVNSDFAPLVAPEIGFVRDMTGVNESSTTVKLLVTRKYGNADSSKISFFIEQANATQGQDFNIDTTKPILFRPYGTVTDTIKVTILIDNKNENTEYVTIKLKNPVNASLGLILSNNIDIYDADKPSNTFFFRGNKVPLYCGSGDTTRTPIVFQGKISGFAPDTKFKYYVKYISLSDTSNPFANGVGTGLFFDSYGNIKQSNTPGFTVGNHDTLTIGFSGEYLGWFGGLNTEDSRFTPGKYVYPMIVLQEVDSIVRPIYKYYLTDSIKVLGFSPAAGGNNGTAIYGNSFAKNKNVVMLYENVMGNSSRPTAITYLESDANAIAKMPNFYNTKVNGVSGAWGTIIPNTLSNGIRRIEVIDPRSLGIFEYFNKENDATWGNDSTVNPHGGLKPIHIKSDNAPLVAPDLQFIANVTNVTEGNKTIKLGVRRRFGNDDSTKISYFVVASSATTGSDYTFNTSKTVVFKPYGDVLDTATITMNILDDILSDPNEDIAVKLTTPQNGLIGTQSTHTVNIIDNDIPKLNFTRNGITVNESVGSIKVRVKLNISPSSATSLKLVVKSKADSTSIPGEFKIGSSNRDTTLQFSGTKYTDSMEVKVPIINDNDEESRNDTIVLALRSPTAPATIGNDSLFTLIVTDNDAPPVISFATNKITVKESAGTINFRINIAGRNTNQSDFSLKFLPTSSTAQEGKDLTFNPTSKIISISTTDPDSLIIPLPILSDNIHEAREDGVFILSNPLNSKIGKPDTLRITILDDDIAEYPISKIITTKTGTGVADSLNTRCKLRGVVYGVNLKPGGTPNGFLFTLIDPTGGIQVINSTGNKGYTVTEGDSVYVIGTIGQLEGMVQMQNIDSLIKLASARVLKVPVVTALLNESTESKLVKINIVKIADPSQWPTTAMAANTIRKVKLVNQNDSFTMLIDSETDIDGSPAPTTFLNVVGLGGQTDPTSPFTSGYVIAPRGLTDIQVLATPVFTFRTAATSTQEYKDSSNAFILEASNVVGNLQINIAIKGGTATNGGTGADYTSNLTRTFILTPGEPSKAIKIKLNDDFTPESNETIIWVIRDNSYGTLIGADSIHTQTIVDNETTSIEDILAKETKLYPNPVRDVLNISASTVISKVSIIDMNGKAVFTLDNINDVNAVINTESLAKGMYNISIVSEKGIFTKTFSKVN